MKILLFTISAILFCIGLFLLCIPFLGVLINKDKKEVGQVAAMTSSIAQGYFLGSIAAAFLASLC